jgi:outer membrane protein
LDQRKTLQECIDLALLRNESQPVARAALAVAEAQHRQALAAYWPQLSITTGAQLRSDDLNFMQPAMNVPVTGLQFQTPALALQTPATSFTLPANAFGPGFPPQAIQVPVASQNVNIPSQNLKLPDMNIHVDEQEIKIMDRASAGASLDLKYLLWDGGGRKAMRDQAKAGIRAAQSDVRRSSLEVIRDVNRYYYGAVLARRLLTVARDAHTRMSATLSLMENLYKSGSEKVLKTDYLRNKILVDTLDGMIRQLEGNRDLAEAALTFTTGGDWRHRITPLGTDLPVTQPGSLDQFVSEAYTFNPDWAKLEAGLDAATLGVKSARTGYLPKLGLTGSLHTLTTGENGVGAATDSNRNGWNIGIGFELPIWDGFLTKNRIAEAKARLETLQHRRLQLEQGLALQIKTGFIQMQSAARQHQACGSALAAARENRQLSEDGFKIDMIEADKVFESQLMEALMESRSLKTAYDHLNARADLEFTAGTSALKTLTNL